MMRNMHEFPSRMTQKFHPIIQNYFKKYPKTKGSEFDAVQSVCGFDILYSVDQIDGQKKAKAVGIRKKIIVAEEFPDLCRDANTDFIIFPRKLNLSQLKYTVHKLPAFPEFYEVNRILSRPESDFIHIGYEIPPCIQTIIDFVLNQSIKRAVKSALRELR